MGVGTPGIIGTRGVPSASLGRRSRLAFLVAAVVLGIALVGVAIWAVADPGRYSTSGAGCVSLTIPSTTGGATLHACGDQAIAVCRAAFATDDRIALLTRPQCVLAGLADPRGSAAAPAA